MWSPTKYQEYQLSKSIAIFNQNLAAVTSKTTATTLFNFEVFFEKILYFFLGKICYFSSNFFVLHAVQKIEYPVEIFFDRDDCHIKSVPLT